ncbi:hypothetical protein E2C01_063735 [Portunus trituberculatus]|uniref:Uncharacterized protein n=1 Tax=Portunus trituberculatus TaxID=210409 RepID=A0A5B7HIG4_PORTR|nr:hypothetical protein [Portunus trituberculatus]
MRVVMRKAQQGSREVGRLREATRPAARRTLTFSTPFSGTHFIRRYHSIGFVSLPPTHVIQLFNFRSRCEVRNNGRGPENRRWRGVSLPPFN